MQQGLLIYKLLLCMASYVNNDSNKLNNISYRDLMVFKVQDLVFLIAHISAAYHFDKQKYLHFHI